MVSTMSESFFFQNFKEKLQSCNWLQLKAANGLEIPYLGYAEFDVEVFGKVVLVVRETPASQVRSAVPGILGMNIIAQCYEELFQRSTSPLFDLPGDTQLAEAWQNAFQACQMPQSMGRQAGLVKVRGKWPVHIPGGTVRWVAATCSQHLAAQTSTALFEPCSRLDAQQPDLLLSPAVVKVVRGTHLHQEGLKVKMEKCCFFQTEVRYLGHVISKDGVATDPDKITAVSNWARPQNVSALRSFLGFASYYMRFVKGFSHVPAPLHRLVQKWGEDSVVKRELSLLERLGLRRVSGVLQSLRLD